MLLFGIPKWPEAAQGESSPPLPIPSAQCPCTEFLGPKPSEAWPVPGTEWPSLLPPALSCPVDLGSPVKSSVCLTPRMEALTWLPCAPVVSQSLGPIASFLCQVSVEACILLTLLIHPRLVRSGPLLETCQPLTSSTSLWVCHFCGTRDTQGRRRGKQEPGGVSLVCYPVWPSQTLVSPSG